ncbi:MAG: sulfite exporter TauE/SafE family protein [Methylotetracoccus sp.]
MLLIISLASGIGILLGMLGGGGSILTVPMLVYVAVIEPRLAIATSLLVVGATSLIGLIGPARRGHVCWRTGVVFGLAGMVGAYTAGRVAAFVPAQTLLLGFAAVMSATAIAMLRGRKATDERCVSAAGLCPARLPLLRISSQGMLVGSVTGLVGAGGGFLIVPALHLLARLPIRAAVGTSLMVLAMQSFSAFAGHAGHVELDLQFALAITAATSIGCLIGVALSPRIEGRTLRRVFGVCVLAVAAFLVYREADWSVVEEGLRLVANLPPSEPIEPWWGLATILIAFVTAAAVTSVRPHDR